MHGSQLNLKEWDARLEAVDAELNCIEASGGRTLA